MAGPREEDKREPSSRQLDAAIEGAKNLVEANPHAGEARGPVDRGGGGAIGGAGGTAQGGGTSTAGPFDDSTNPADETGGPRGSSGYPPSQTSGGKLSPDDDPRGVEPDEAIKRETAVFEPGTHGRKPHPE